MSNPALIVVIIVAVIVVAALVVAGLQIARKKQSERLRAQYGPEYDRAVQRADSPREAESELREREKRHKKLELRDLEPKQKADFDRRWKDLQGEFVDDPSGAVRGADLLVVEVMEARGYPVDDFDQRADDLSVSHPEVTQRYREARTIAKSNEDGSADTEDLRKAVTSYRALVVALVHDGSGDHDRAGDKSRDAQSPNGAAPATAQGSRPDTGRSDMGKGASDTGRSDMGKNNGDTHSSHVSGGDSGHNGQAGVANGRAHDDQAAVRATGRDSEVRKTERENS
jgi:hypothetical protein